MQRNKTHKAYLIILHNKIFIGINVSDLKIPSSGIECTNILKVGLITNNIIINNKDCSRSVINPIGLQLMLILLFIFINRSIILVMFLFIHLNNLKNYVINILKI